MDILKKWESLDEYHKLSLLIALEESKIEAFRMAKNILPYPHTLIIGLLADLSKEWGLGTNSRL